MKIKEIIKNIIYKEDLENACVDIWRFAEINFDYHYFDLTPEDIVRYGSDPGLLLDDQIEEFIIDYLYEDPSSQWKRGNIDTSFILEELNHFDHKYIEKIFSKLIQEGKIELDGDINYLKLTNKEQLHQEKLRCSKV